jgi:hypothetical protein
MFVVGRQQRQCLCGHPYGGQMQEACRDSYSDAKMQKMRQRRVEMG